VKDRRGWRGRRQLDRENAQKVSDASDETVTVHAPVDPRPTPRWLCWLTGGHRWKFGTNDAYCRKCERPWPG
jgi:hypothetical protein